MIETLIYVTISIGIILLLSVKQKRYWENHLLLFVKTKRAILICLLLIGLAYTSLELQKNKKTVHTEFNIGSLDNTSIGQINILDRGVAGRWDIEAKDNGKIFKNIAVYLIPFLLFLFRGSVKQKLILFFIFSQGYILTESITGLVKGLVDRYRPFAYMSRSGLEQLPAKGKEKFLEDSVDYDILNSFFSGDASILAYGFAFFAFSYSIIYTNRVYKNAVWLVAILGICLGCYFRVVSGKHFPTDVIVGGIVGGFIAFLILKLHVSKAIKIL